MYRYICVPGERHRKVQFNKLQPANGKAMNNLTLVISCYLSECCGCFRWNGEIPGSLNVKKICNCIICIKKMLLYFCDIQALNKVTFNKDVFILKHDATTIKNLN